MTTRRDFRRVFRHHGIKVFATPVVVVLLLAVVADQRLDGYLEHRQQAEELQVQLDSHRQLLGLDANIRRKAAELEPAYAAVAPQVQVAADPKASLAAQQEQLRQLLQSLYFGDIEFFEMSVVPQGAASRLVVHARFTGVPQQLPRLEAALSQSPKIAAIDRLELRVAEDPQRPGPQLAISARFVGLHMAPLPEGPAAAAAPNTPARP